MKKFLLFFVSILILLSAALFIYVQYKRQNKPKPAEAITEVLKIDVPPSAFNLPISYDIKNFSEFLNNKINGKFLEKNIFLQQSKKEEIALTLTKNEKIIIETKGKELLCTFPLTVDATLLDCRFGKAIARQVKPVHTSLIITLSTPVSLDKTWNVVTQFKIRTYKWIEEPIVKIGPIKKNLKRTLDDVLTHKGSELTHMLDDEIHKAVSLKPAISKIWDDIQKPILINKKIPQTWIRFICTDIKGKIVLYPTKITCFTNVKAKTLMITDTATEAKPSPLPNFNPLKEKDKDHVSDIHLYAYTSFDEINDQLNGLLKGKSFTAQGYTVAIKELKAFASTKGLSVEIITDKDVEGSLIVSGQLVFDVPHQTLRVQHFDFDLNTNSTIINTSHDVLHDIIRDTIASKLAVNLDTLIQKVPNIIHNAIAKGNTGKVIDMNVENLEIKKCEIFMGKKRIHFKINVGVEAGLKLKKLNAGKAIAISDQQKK